MPNHKINNPNELLKFLFSDPASAAAVRADADFTARLEASFDRLRKIAKRKIREEGLDPAQSRKIALHREAADAVFWAAHMLTELDRVQQYLRLATPSELEGALEEVLSSLVFAGLYHTFTVTDPEPRVVEFAARGGTSKGGQARADRYATLARQVAAEFQKRQHARDLAAGAMMGAIRPSDAELTRQIGVEYGLGKSAAADMIKHGLTLLNHAGAASG